jgi:RNA ligase
MLINKLNKYIEEGWVMKQVHPTLPLSIYNYTQATQYESHWDEITLMCRGLILNAEGDIIAKPFGKFFNYEELYQKNVIPWFESEHVTVQDKMDGSLGILFNYFGEWIMATRGSFTSDQAIKGLEIVKENCDLSRFDTNLVYVGEIIYPENRIVVDYGFEEKFTFLSVFNKEEELDWDSARKVLYSHNVDNRYIVKSETHKPIGHSLYELLKDKNTENEEGYVLRFSPSNFRTKIKFTDYVALHRILTQCSTYDIYENLKLFGKLPEAMLADVPDEFFDWVKATEKSIRDAYAKIEEEYKWIFKVIMRADGVEDRAVFASFAKRYKYSGILFCMYTEKDYSQHIWKLIKPAYGRPFADK